MKKNYSKFLTILVMVCCFSFTLSSCSDDDDENHSKDDPQIEKLDYSLFLGSWQRIYNSSMNIQRLNFGEDTHSNWNDGERGGTYYYTSGASNMLYSTRWGVNGKQLYVNCYYNNTHMGNFAFEVKEITEDKLTVVLLRKSDNIFIIDVTEELGTEITFVKN